MLNPLIGLHDLLLIEADPTLRLRQRDETNYLQQDMLFYDILIPVVFIILYLLCSKLGITFMQ